ncbi:MAG TPA: hypothetical protein VI306_07390 [Pyrinomonadaceae bacterium]
MQDLYTSIFPEFVIAVVEYFQDSLLNDKQTASGTDPFLRLCQKEIDGLEETSEPPWLASVDSSMRELIDTHRAQLVLSHLKGKLPEQKLVDLACLPLMRLIGTVRQLGEPTIAASFRDWLTLLKLPRLQSLKIALLDWSEKWNLDADWCRDYAIKVLRQLLFDEPHRWTFLNVDPNPLGVTPTRNSQISGHWKFVARDGEFAVGWSQATLSGDVFLGDPADFSFDYRGLPFRVPGFNPIIESAIEWKRKVEIDFRVLLYTGELQRLTKLKNSLDEDADLENEFSRYMQVFDDQVSKHIKDVQLRLEYAEVEQGLLRVKEKRQPDKHIAWTVRYQIPRSNNQGCELAKEIAVAEGLKSPAVSIAVTELLLEIGLNKRRSSSGRKRGSKDSVSTQTLRNLARDS